MKKNIKNPITKKIQVGFLVCFLAMELFGFSTRTTAAACSISVFWRDSKNQSLATQPTTVKTGTSLYAVATFSNCQQLQPYIILFGPPYGDTKGTYVGLGSNLSATQATEERNAVVSFPQDGSYYFKGSATLTYYSSNSGSVEASQSGGSGSPPAGTTCSPVCTDPKICQNGACVDRASPGGTPAATVSTSLINPIQTADNLTDLLINIMKGFFGVIAVWAGTFVVIGGFQLVVSAGNEEVVLKAKKTILWAVLGLAVAVLSFAIIAIVENLIGVKIQPPPTSMLNLIAFL